MRYLRGGIGGGEEDWGKGEGVLDQGGGEGDVELECLWWRVGRG